MERKSLEDIESLLFALGAGAGHFLSVQDYAWWIVLLVVLVLSVVVGKLVYYLRKMNKKNLGNQTL